MHDDFHSPSWAAQHKALSASIHAMIGAIGKGLARLNAYEFDAPWRHRPSRP